MLLYCTSAGSKVRHHEPCLLKDPHKCYQHKGPNLFGLVVWVVKYSCGNAISEAGDRRKRSEEEVRGRGKLGNITSFSKGPHLKSHSFWSGILLIQLIGAWRYAYYQKIMLSRTAEHFFGKNRHFHIRQ